MKKLPSIYKSPVKVNNNLGTYYSKNQTEENFSISKSTVHQKNDSMKDMILEIFKNKSYSYTKKVRVTVLGRTYETRFIQENNGKILTIDNDIIEERDIEKLEILS